MYFAGFAISSGIIPPISDKVGRKWIFIVSLTVQTICYAVVVFTINIRYVVYSNFIIGLCSGGFMTMIAYLNEFLLSEMQNVMCTILNGSDASVLIVQSLYYDQYSNWAPLHMFGLIFSTCMIFVVMLIPESPKFNYV